MDANAPVLGASNGLKDTLVAERLSAPRSTHLVADAASGTASAPVGDAAAPSHEGLRLRQRRDEALTAELIATETPLVLAIGQT